MVTHSEGRIPVSMRVWSRVSPVSTLSSGEVLDETLSDRSDRSYHQGRILLIETPTPSHRPRFSPSKVLDDILSPVVRAGPRSPSV